MTTLGMLAMILVSFAAGWAASRFNEERKFWKAYADVQKEKIDR